MKKKLLIMLMITLLCTGCSQKQEETKPDEGVSEGQVVYSTLVDDATQKELSDCLIRHGIANEQVDTLLNWVSDFNARVTSTPLPKGFRPMKYSVVDYSGLIVEGKELPDGELLPEVNCRLTSYLLMKNNITTNGKTISNDTYLMFDVDAIQSYDQFHLSEEETTEFTALFNWVPVDGLTTVAEHVEKIQSAWADREIQIDGEGVSLVTVYLHSPLEDVRFVGHTGVLFEEDNGLVFVEKYGPQYPFQFTKFNNREELKKYLLRRTDLYGDQSELSPIVMENNQLL